MGWIVNVEGLEFEDMIPYLRKNNHIKEAVSYEYLNGRQVKISEKRVFDRLKILLSKLKKGNPAENHAIGMGFAQCLDKVGRVLTTHEFDGDVEEYSLQPISKLELELFSRKLESLGVK